MKVEELKKYTLVTIDKDSFTKFRMCLHNFTSNHLLVEVSENLNMDEKKISLFLDVSADFRNNGMSFVIIKSGIDIDDFPESLNIVPTLQEAEDILDMEAIERDLGF